MQKYYIFILTFESMKRNITLLIVLLCSLGACKRNTSIDEKIHRNWKAEKIKTQNPDLVAMGLDLSRSPEFQSWSEKKEYHTNFLGKYKIEGDSIHLTFDSYQTNDMPAKKDTSYTKSYKIEALNDSSFHLKVNQFDAFFTLVK